MKIGELHLRTHEPIFFIHQHNVQLHS